MVHDDGHVPLALAVADLIDPDPSELVEQIDLAHSLRGDPFEDRAERAGSPTPGPIALFGARAKSAQELVASRCCARGLPAGHTPYQLERRDRNERPF
jgi:hypothetical protein